MAVLRFEHLNQRAVQDEARCRHVCAYLRTGQQLKKTRLQKSRRFQGGSTGSFFCVG